MSLPTPPPSSSWKPSSNKVDTDVCAREAADTRETGVQVGDPYYSRKCLVTLQELDLLSCPVCLNVPQDQVYFCSNGHSFCEQCAKKLDLCPLCRTAFKDQSVRNIALERLLDLKRFQCLYFPNGCNFLDMSRKDLAQHLGRCEFHPAATKICHLLKLFHGWELSSNDECPHAFRLDSILDSSNSDQVDSLMDHFNRTHNFAQAVINFPEQSTCQVTFTKLLSASKLPPKSKILSNLIIHTCSGNSPGNHNFKTHGLYLLLIRVDNGAGESKLERTLSLACVRLNHPPTPEGNKKDGQILFTIKGGDPLYSGADDISWEDEPITLEDLNTLMTTKAEEKPKFKFSLPFTFLQENYAKFGAEEEEIEIKMTLLVDFTKTFPTVLGKATGKDVTVKPRYQRFEDLEWGHYEWFELGPGPCIAASISKF